MIIKELSFTFLKTSKMTEKKTIACPYCWEEILAAAKKCKHCWEFLDKDLEPKKKKGCLYWALTILVILIVFIVWSFILWIIAHNKARDMIIEKQEIAEAVMNWETDWIAEEDIKKAREEFIKESNDSFRESDMDLKLEYVDNDTVAVISEKTKERWFKENMEKWLRRASYKKVIYKNKNWETIEEREL